MNKSDNSLIMGMQCITTMMMIIFLAGELRCCSELLFRIRGTW